jgi:hypothetical protein
MAYVDGENLSEMLPIRKRRQRSTTPFRSVRHFRKHTAEELSTGTSKPTTSWSARVDSFRRIVDSGRQTPWGPTDSSSDPAHIRQ